MVAGDAEVPGGDGDSGVAGGAGLVGCGCCVRLRGGLAGGGRCQEVCADGCEVVEDCADLPVWVRCFWGWRQDAEEGLCKGDAGGCQVKGCHGGVVHGFLGRAWMRLMRSFEERPLHVRTRDRCWTVRPRATAACW